MSALRFLRCLSTSLTQCMYPTKNIHQKSFIYTLNSYNKCVRCFTSTSPVSKKVPFLERWKKYWQDLVTDYQEALRETFEDCKKNPRRTGFLFMCSAVAYACIKTNPDEINFRENVVKCCNEVLLVGPSIRNRNTEQFLTSVETFYNLGVIRRFSFGLFSVIWIDNFSNELGAYKAKCSYLKPQFTTFSNRVVDVGFFGRWWKLNSVMKDYDVNEEEWLNDGQTMMH